MSGLRDFTGGQFIAKVQFLFVVVADICRNGAKVNKRRRSTIWCSLIKLPMTSSLSKYRSTS